MTEAQFNDMSKRVEQYSVLKSELERLKNERYRISCGVQRVYTICDNSFDCRDRYNNFTNKMESALLALYDKEIAELEGKMWEL